MKILLDTCVFLWIVTGDGKLSKHAKKQFLDPGNDIYLSTVSAWEISIKYALGRLLLPESPGRFIPDLRRRHGMDSLPLDEESALHLARLPALHNDPFDRMLVCQAIVQGMLILTPDELISQYPVRTAW
jgi:PIN domain nuclease of toxin-antitoxin system